MKYTLTNKTEDCDILFVLHPKKSWSKATYSAFPFESIQKELQKRLKSDDFTGESGETLQVFETSKKAQRVIFVGLGEEKKIDAKVARKTGEIAVKEAKKKKAKTVGFIVPKSIALEHLLEGASRGNYVFKVTEEKSKTSPVKEAIAFTDEVWEKDKMTSENALSQAIDFSRNLVDLPSNMMTPVMLAAKAQEIGKMPKSPVKVTVMGEKQLTKLGFKALLEVGRGSDDESQAVVLEYNGAGRTEPKIAFVGKGVTYDTGGYNLKPTGYIETMKCDMAGAATVLGLFHWLAITKPKVNVIGMIGCVSNDISGHAYKPGDIISSLSGKTIQVDNTDAEGRLVLADCLHYVTTKYKPVKLFDAATLTGAVISALGTDITGIMTNNEKLVKEVKTAAEKAQEKVWELPLNDSMREAMKGKFCDLTNCAPRGFGCGSSTAAAFLENFINDTDWVHFDIAGTAFNGKYGAPGPEQATGVMVRTFSEIVKANV